MKFQIKSSVVIATITGRSAGSVTFQNRRQAPAPSTAAASCSSRAIALQPGQQSDVVCGMPTQTPTMITAGSAV